MVLGQVFLTADRPSETAPAHAEKVALNRLPLSAPVARAA